MRIETIFSPAELPALAADDLRGAVCVVFDILRATSTIVTALHHGARRVVPVREIPEAIEVSTTPARGAAGGGTEQGEDPG